MFQRHAPLAVRRMAPRFNFEVDVANAAQLRYPALYGKIKGRMVRLAEYSRDCLKTLRAATGTNKYEGRRGTLQLFRTAQQYENLTRDIAVLEDAGVPYQLPRIQPTGES